MTRKVYLTSGQNEKVFVLLGYCVTKMYTAVLRKVVPQKRLSVRDNVEWYYGYWWLTVS